LKQHKLTEIVNADGLRTTASIAAYGTQDRTIGHGKRQNVKES
jgi:hypothetical protein